MGHYTELNIGDYYFSWKYDIPSILTLLIKDEIFFKDEVIDEYEEDGEKIVEKYFAKIGYRCTAKEAREILNDAGYNIEEITKIYDFFYDTGDPQYHIESSLEEYYHEEDIDIPLEKYYEKYISSFSVLSKQDELRDFINFFPKLIPPNKDRFRGQNPIYELFELSDHTFYFDIDAKYPPWVIRTCLIINSDNFSEFTEIIYVFFIRLLIEAMPEDAIVEIDLNDILEEETEIKTIRDDLTGRLVEKIQLYNGFFKPLIQEKEILREKYVKSYGKKLLQDCLDEKNSFKKGRLFEEFTELIFTSNNYLEISDKNYKTGDEEIDLIILNKTKNNFWSSFGAMLFVECKNWSKSVGTKEVRDFETKLRNHSGVTKLGFFVSINGFTSEVKNHLKRIGREDYHITLISKTEIEDYLNSDHRYFDWLEKNVRKIY